MLFAICDLELSELRKLVDGGTFHRVKIHWRTATRQCGSLTPRASEAESANIVSVARSMLAGTF